MNTNAPTNTLHCVWSTREHALPDSLLRLLSDNDAIVLLSDAVYSALTMPIDRFPSSVTLFAHRDDVEARGLLTHWPATIPLVDDAGLVDLTVRYGKSLSWSAA